MDIVASHTLSESPLRLSSLPRLTSLKEKGLVMYFSPWLENFIILFIVYLFCSFETWFLHMTLTVLELIL